MTASDQPDTLNTASTAPTGTEKPAAADPATGADAGQPAGVDAQLAAAKQEAAVNYDRYLRSVADFENFKRRTVREKDELRQFAVGRLLEDLLPVIDNLALAVTAAKSPTADLKTIVQGVTMVQDQLKTAISGHGLKEINPAGQKFDPNQHESIASQPSPDVPEGSVLQVVRIGYSLNGRLLRPASVVVSGGPAKTGAASA